MQQSPTTPTDPPVLHSLTIPNAIAVHRQALGLTQRQLAEVARIPLKLVRCWEHGRFARRELAWLRLGLALGRFPHDLVPEVIAELADEIQRRKAEVLGGEVLAHPPLSLPPTVLGLHPSGRYVFWAAFVDRDLRDFGVLDLNKRPDRTDAGLRTRVAEVVDGLITRFHPAVLARTRVPDKPAFVRAHLVAKAVDAASRKHHLRPGVLPLGMIRGYVAGTGPLAKIHLALILVCRFPCLGEVLRPRPPAVDGRAATLAPFQKATIDAICVGYTAACHVDNRLSADLTVTRPTV